MTFGVSPTHCLNLSIITIGSIRVTAVTHRSPPRRGTVTELILANIPMSWVVLYESEIAHSSGLGRNHYIRITIPLSLGS